MKTIRLMALLAIALDTLNVNAQTEEIIYYAKLPQVELSKAKTRFLSLISGYNDLWAPSRATFLEDRIELAFDSYIRKKTFTRIEFIYFSDMFNYPIRVTKSAATPVLVSKGAYVKKFNYLIRLKKSNVFAVNSYSELLVSDGSLASLTEGSFWLAKYSKQDENATESNYKELADYLYYFQHQYAIQRYDSLLNAFKPLAAQYCELREKPPVLEEQRKFIVQANIFNEQKMYEKAIELYNKAIEFDQTSYPAAYSNLALLSAQVNQFDAAIYYMKKYLLLEPEATDARSAQDKIYEWEAKL